MPAKLSLTEKIDSARRAQGGWDAAAAAKPKALFGSPFAIGDKVQIDGHTNLVAVVTGGAWYGTRGCLIEVSWLHNGVTQIAWIHPSRLKAV